MPVAMRRNGLAIAVFGSSLVSAYWNGAATYYRGMLSALARRGHRITFFEPDAFARQQHRDIPDPDWARVVVYPPTERAAAECLAEARDADLVVKASGVGVLDEWLEAAVPELKTPGRLVAFWDVDAPATLARLDADPADPFRALIPDYDLILTYGGGMPVIDGYRRFGAREVVPVYNGLDPATHFPVPPDPRFEGRLGLLANRLPDREQRIERFFLDVAPALPEEVFLLGGNGWAEKPVPANVRRLGHVFTADHNAFNSSVSAVLNISRESMARNGFSPATRVFEAAGAAACLITDDWPGIDEFLEPDREVLVARSGEEVAGIVRSLAPAQARRIGEAARRRVLADHTYDRRAAMLEQVLTT